MKILGIETSCDETAASVVEDGARILSNVVVSQIDIFAAYGGVIPEVAARSHLEAILPVVDKALADAHCTWADIDAIAVTHAPGLLGSLLIGTLTARTLAILYGKPLYAVHHLKSHIYANWLASEPRPTEAPLVASSDAHSIASGDACPIAPEASENLPKFPLLALVISGGHTQILYMPGHNQFEIIGTTRDDAVGECFDKVAKILGLPYPGGPAIAKAASGELPADLPAFQNAPTAVQNAPATVQDTPAATQIALGDPDKYPFPHPKVDGLDFSFSGLKTAVLRAVQKELNLPISHPSHDLKNHLTPTQVADFAASFQKTAIAILLAKLSLALADHPEAKSLVFAGGVSANRELRTMSKAVAEIASSPENLPSSHHDLKYSNNPHTPRCFFPLPQLSGDNGAMVAAAAYFEIQSGIAPIDPYQLNIYPRIAIDK